jgi:MurNAc alpha-1-phosphate uridylyltransferase
VPDDLSKASRTAIPSRAMVLAAGLGTRMRDHNAQIPKPLVAVGGRTLIDYVLDRLEAVGVKQVVVNVHHLADQIERHLATRPSPAIIISDERDQLLDTGGGVIRALPHLGPSPFFHINSDTIWIDGVRPNLIRLAAAFDRAQMDGLLLMASTTSSIGYGGRGDFRMDPNGRLARRGEREVVPFAYAGAAILTPEFFAGTPPGPSSMSPLFNRAIEAGRLFGLRLEGTWMHVGTAEAVKAAEHAIAASAA